MTGRSEVWVTEARKDRANGGPWKACVVMAAAAANAEGASLACPYDAATEADLAEYWNWYVNEVIARRAVKATERAADEASTAYRELIGGGA